MKFEELKRPVDDVVRDWKDLGLTHPMSPELSIRSDKAALRRMLDLCDDAELNLIVHDWRAHLGNAVRRDVVKDDTPYRAAVEAAAEWRGHASFAGFHLYDEPRSNDVLAVVRAAQVVQAAIPGKMCFLNLLPWYDWIAPTLGAESYGPYLDDMAKRTGLPMMCYDCYDQLDENTRDTTGLDSYFTNLREWSEHVKRNPGQRYWVTQQCFSQFSRVLRSQDDIRWQISTAAAMGAKGIVWYYVENVRRSGNNRHLPINEFGERTESFRWLSEENRAFRRQFGAEFMRLTFDGARFVNLLRGGIKAFEPGRDVLSVECYKVPKPILVSFFHDETDVRYFALVNLHREKSAHLTVGLADGVSAARLEWEGDYRSVKSARDPVLATRYGQSTVSSFGLDLAPGQLSLFRVN